MSTESINPQKNWQSVPRTDQPHRAADAPHRWRTPTGAVNDWDCHDPACGHTSAVHTVDEQKGLSPLHRAAKFECEVDGCRCAGLTPHPATLRTLGVRPHQVGKVRD